MDNKFEKLIEAVCTNDASGTRQAAAIVEKEYGSSIRRIIRRLLRTGRANSPFEEQLLAEAHARRQQRQDSDSYKQDALVADLSFLVCRALVSAQARQRSTRETVTCNQEFHTIS